MTLYVLDLFRLNVGIFEEEDGVWEVMSFYIESLGVIRLVGVKL